MQTYLSQLRKPFIKRAKIEFLQPDGSVAFALDNNPRSGGAFIQDGTINVNLQNGPRRQANVVLNNVDGEYDYRLGKSWFGQQIRLSEGLVLPDGTDFYLPQGVFYIKAPEESVKPSGNTVTYNLVDKWAYLDGSLFGNLDSTYEVPYGSAIFDVILALLQTSRGNGEMIDSLPPIFTNWYNGKTQTLPDGSTANLTDTPYTFRNDGDSGTLADVILAMNTMLAGWIGYDATGRLRLDPSQDDILDTTKPVLWQFNQNEAQILGATYTVKNSDVFNDIIVLGESTDDYAQAGARATNLDPRSDTNANLIGKKTRRETGSGYYTYDQCAALAEFRLKRLAVLQKSVTIECTQMFHISENNLVTVVRETGSTSISERHLITGFSRPIAQGGSMTLQCTSVNDFPIATMTPLPWE